MEELVGSIQDSQTMDYMSESLSCYMAGAYRASIVLTFIALFDDILTKLTELGKVNKKARGIADSASQKRADQEVFETYLIDQLRSNALLSSLDITFLDTLRTLRNKSAHPSGHHASAEEARFVFYEAITRFLAKPILSTTQLADEVLASLGNSNLFPSTSIDAIAKVTARELQNIHHETYPYLVSKLLEKTQGADGTTTKNARFFLNGLAWNGDAHVLAALRKYVIEKTASNTAFSNVVLSLLCANGGLFQDLDEVTYQRIAVLVTDQIGNVEISVEHTKFSHPASLFVSLLQKNDEQFVLQRLGAQLDAFIERFPYSAYFTSKVAPFGVTKGRLLARLAQNARSSDFGTANAFARHSGDVEKLLGDGFSPEEAFKLLVGVVRSAEIGAYGSIDLRNSHFGSMPKLRGLALERVASDSATARTIAAEILGIPEANVDNELLYLQPPAPDAQEI
jgi:hypothetical protein